MIESLNIANRIIELFENRLKTINDSHKVMDETSEFACSSIRYGNPVLEVTPDVANPEYRLDLIYDHEDDCHQIQYSEYKRDGKPRCHIYIDINEEVLAKAPLTLEEYKNIRSTN